MNIENKYAFDKGNISIPIKFDNIPEGTKSFIIVFHDLHPWANNWIHWSVINIPVNVMEIPEGVSNTNNMIGIELNNDFGQKGYGGPCPPQLDGEHEYQLSIFAMNVDKLDTFKLNNRDYLRDTELREKFKDNIIDEFNISSFYKTI